MEAAEGAHSVLLHRMGDRVVELANLKEVKKFEQDTLKAIQSLLDKNRSLKVVHSIQFNNGTCNRQSEHEWKNMLLKNVPALFHSKQQGQNTC